MARKRTVAKKFIKSTELELEQAKMEFASFIKNAKEEHGNIEVEIVIKAEI